MKKLFPFLSILLFISSCSIKKTDDIFIPKDIVIAHRGTTYWAPEETEAAYRWARDIGAHYLEVDIQRSKDGVLMALHDNQLTRTTDVNEVYPEQAQLASSAFTFEQLLQLDAGSWFNQSNADRAKEEFSKNAPLTPLTEKAFYFDDKGNKQILQDQDVYVGGMQQILSLEDVIRIAEGYRIAKDSSGKRIYKTLKQDGRVKYQFFYVTDPECSGHKPGVYIETKEPQLFPGVEKDLFNELDRLNWNQITNSSLDTMILKNGKVNIANTSAKIILQTFSPESLQEIEKLFKTKIPVCFLLWLGDPNMPDDNKETYDQNLLFAKKYGANIIGPSIGGEPNNYSNLLKDQHYQWIRDAGFLIHPYSFDTKEQTKLYGPKCDGMFTNRAEITLSYYSNK